MLILKVMRSDHHRKRLGVIAWLNLDLFSYVAHCHRKVHPQSRKVSAESAGYIYIYIDTRKKDSGAWRIVPTHQTGRTCLAEPRKRHLLFNGGTPRSQTAAKEQQGNPLIVLGTGISQASFFVALKEGSSSQDHKCVLKELEF